MNSIENITIQHLSEKDIKLMQDLLNVFGDAFDEVETYRKTQPKTDYLHKLLSRDYFIVLVALKHGKVVGGLAAYELYKFEQERSEIYIYDLAVSTEYRWQGIAMAL
ncbi:MAG: GNAT family N-acetyltransferase, partial [Okeania sp. SIO3B3]|nr:GNAT family N-acetyltransferase [Okeania sp. SIO3B3]